VSRLNAALFDPKRRISYRRLLAFGTATALLVSGYIGEQTWWYVTGVFIAAEIAGKAVGALGSRTEAPPPA
jgi:hypothetical protein